MMDLNWGKIIEWFLKFPCFLCGKAFHTRLEEKDVEISALEKKLQTLQIYGKFIDDLQSTTGKTVDEIVDYLKIMSPSSLSGNSERGRLASEFLEMKEKEWLDGAITFAKEKCPELLNTKQKQKKFSDDIYAYYKWLYSGLRSGYIADKIDISHSITKSLPYKYALDFLREKVSTINVDDLPLDEIKELRLYIDHLYEYVTTKH